MKLLVASSPFNAIADDNGELVHLGAAALPKPVDLGDMSREKFLQVAVVKWGMRKVIGPSGEEQPSYPGLMPLPIQIIELSSGEAVYQLTDNGAGAGTKLNI